MERSDLVGGGREMRKLTKRERAALEQELHNLTEEALELERKAQKIQRRLSLDAAPEASS